jgi:hypothetical protein
MVQKTAEEIVRAVDGVLSGEFKSSWEAWKKTGVSRQTIHAIRGTRRQRYCHISLQTAYFFQFLVPCLLSAVR